MILYREAGLPEIFGNFDSVMNMHGNHTSGAFSILSIIGNFDGGPGVIAYHQFNASHCSAVYGGSETVQPSTGTVNYSNFAGAEHP